MHGLLKRDEYLNLNATEVDIRRKKSLCHPPRGGATSSDAANPANHSIKQSLGGVSRIAEPCLEQSDYFLSFFFFFFLLAIVA